MTARKPLPVDLIDALLADYKKSEDLIGKEDISSN
jgi:putative transposase